MSVYRAGAVVVHSRLFVDLYPIPCAPALIVTLVWRRGPASGPAWDVGEGMTVGIDHGCEIVTLDQRFSRCSSCPLDRCWLDHSHGDRVRAARLVRRLGGTPPKFWRISPRLAWSAGAAVVLLLQRPPHMPADHAHDDNEEPEPHDDQGRSEGRDGGQQVAEGDEEGAEALHPVPSAGPSHQVLAQLCAHRSRYRRALTEP